MKYLALSDPWRLNTLIKGKPLTVNGQSRILDRFRQVFPLTLFPGELIIEELRIIYLKRNGPWTSEVISIMATDIACVNASSGPFFGRVHIQSLTGGPEIMVESLLRKNVFQIRSYVEGIALASREGLKVETESLEQKRQNFLTAGAVKV